MRLVQFKLAGFRTEDGSGDVWVDADSVRMVTRYIRQYNAGTQRFSDGTTRHIPASSEVVRGVAIIALDVSTTKTTSLHVSGEPEEVVKRLMGSIAEQLLAERIELQRRLVQVDVAMEKVGG